MLASIFAAKKGCEVTLFEKNEKLGKKLYITGKGRCNVTNNCEPEELLNSVVTEIRTGRPGYKQGAALHAAADL